ncbi:endonuclease domain-containing protein [Pontibacter diazotrophicus]|uniref:Endonuclease domain-containing protein n=1 Tax=Pontibacter diazotrophicus TaxID=1400979 RepID=A0A3D8LBS2_9BACT|nr:DUF559 domain-containing protein [Pontibacter diazotrophicus]RDV14850.1 endonuclease domain-containing protein [Pontibacter diazotrophicus]
MRRNKIIPYRQDLKLKARELRKNSTLSEVLLWQEIKDKKLLGFQFHRQVPLLDYIVDFYCHELQLAIEIDGDSHENKGSYDKKRQKELEAYGVCVVRFDDLDVKKMIRYVLNEIAHYIHNIDSGSATPL